MRVSDARDPRDPREVQKIVPGECMVLMFQNFLFFTFTAALPP